MPILVASFLVLVLMVENGGHSPEERVLLLSWGGAVLGGRRRVADR